jgi:hypothetical protein
MRSHIPVVGAALELVALQFKHTCGSYTGVLVGRWYSGKVAGLCPRPGPLGPCPVVGNKLRGQLDFEIRESTKDGIEEGLELFPPMGDSIGSQVLIDTVICEKGG